MGMNIITFGTFDLFHQGHYNILKRASEYGNLYVGVSSDWFSSTKKGFRPVDNESIRMNNVKSLNFVKDVFLEESMEKKQEYIDKYKIDLFIMGDDWKGKFELNNCKVIYLPRTPDISSTEIKKSKNIKSLAPKIKLNGTYSHPLTDSNEIFPLKKIYNFYGRKLYGPNNYNTMDNFYSKKYPMMKYGKVKWNNNNCFKGGAPQGYFDVSNILKDEYEPDYKIDLKNRLNEKDIFCTKEKKACFYQGHIN